MWVLTGLLGVRSKVSCASRFVVVWGPRCGGSWEHHPLPPPMRRGKWIPFDIPDLPLHGGEVECADGPVSGNGVVCTTGCLFRHSVSRCSVLPFRGRGTLLDLRGVDPRSRSEIVPGDTRVWVGQTWGVIP